MNPLAKLPYAALASVLLSCNAHPAEGGGTAPAANPVAIDSGAHDFDFLMGDWLIDNKKLRKPLEDASDWETFQARLHAQKLPAGMGNVDEFVADVWRSGFVGVTLRLFNPETALWSIYWLTQHNGGIDSKTGALAPPVVGRFQDGVGIFEGADEFNGKPITVRYTWEQTSANTARWEQAFSEDAGKHWETNWVMAFTRVVL